MPRPSKVAAQETRRAAPVPSGASGRAPRAVAAWFVLALLVRAGTAALVRHPGYVDAFYYFHAATRLVRGQGLTETVVWNYLAPPPALPAPAAAYWPPGAALLAAAGQALLGRSALGVWRASQAGPVLLSAAVVAGTYWLSRRWLAGTPHAPRLAGTAAGLALFSGVYAPYWVTTDSFTPFAAVGGGVLLLAGEFALAPRWRLLYGAGLLAGLAAWTRPDGALLLSAPLVAILGARCWSRPGGMAKRAAGLLAGFAAGAAPWLARNWLTWGRLVPPGTGGALWLRAYDDLFAFRDPPSFERWLQGGLREALAVRLGAVAGNAFVLGQPLLYYLVPVAVAGWWQLRRHHALRPAVAYLVALVAVMTALFPFQSVRGGLFHSLSALLPFLYLWSATGLAVVVGAAARRRRWSEPAAQRAFAVAVVGFGIVSSVYFTRQLTARWDARAAAYHAAAGWVDANAAPAARVMVVDPPGFWYASGRAAVVTPSDGFDALTAAAARYDVDYLLLERAAPAYLMPVYDGTAPAPDLERVATVEGIQVYRILLRSDVERV